MHVCVRVLVVHCSTDTAALLRAVAVIVVGLCISACWQQRC
jgi:hypothetical protein